MSVVSAHGELDVGVALPAHVQQGLHLRGGIEGRVC